MKRCKQKKQTIAAVLTVFMLISMVPFTNHTASAAVSNPAYLWTPILGTSINILPVRSEASVYLGQYPQDTTEPNNRQPIKWSVVLKNVQTLGNMSAVEKRLSYFPQYSAGAVTLISEKILDTCDFMDFQSSWTLDSSKWHKPYSKSKLHQFLNGAFMINAFSQTEMDALSNDSVHVWGGVYYASEQLIYTDETIQAKVFAPDFYIHGTANDKGELTINKAAEVTTYAAAQKWSNGFLEKNAYWLRTVPLYNGLYPCDQAISVDGRFVMGDHSVKTRALTLGVRPMTRVMDSNVILVSQVGAKDSASVINDELTGEKEYEFTLYDSTRNFKATPTGDVIYGEHSATVNLSYSGANVGANEYISYILTDDKGNVYKYQRLKTVTSPSGTISIEIDYEDFGNNCDCQLRVFNEQINSGSLTDYASTYSTVEICRDPSYHLPIWIGGTHLNLDNAEYYGYDISTNTLTIVHPYNPFGNNLGSYVKDGVSYGIYVEGDLNIIYNPTYLPSYDYKWISTGPAGLSQTVLYVSGDLNITSYSGKNLSIDNQAVTRVPEMNGIVCGGKLTISNMTLTIDTGNGVSMSAIKAKSIELYNVKLWARTAFGTDDWDLSSGTQFGSNVISCESYYQKGGTVEVIPRYSGALGTTSLQLLGEGNFELDGKATLNLDGNYIGGSKTLEQAVANKDITVTTEGNKKILKANGCSQHETSYRTEYARAYEECLYCKEILGYIYFKVPYDLYYDGTPKLVKVYGHLPSNPEITISYWNHTKGETGVPVEVGLYTATFTVGSKTDSFQFSIVENTTGEKAKTEFEQFQERINTEDVMFLSRGAIVAESTDKSLIIPEGKSVEIRLAEFVFDRSNALEKGPVFDVRGTLKLVCYQYDGSNLKSLICGGTDSAFYVRPGGTLILSYYDNVEITGNTAFSPGAGIYCAGTLIEEGHPLIYGNTSNGKESGIHIADGGQLIYKAGKNASECTPVVITRDYISKPIASIEGTEEITIKNIAKRYVSGYDNLTTYFDKTAGKLYLVPKGINYTLGTYIDHYTSKESGSGNKEYIKRSDFDNDSVLDLVSTSKDGSFGYIQVKEGSSNKNVQLSFTTFAISMAVPANTTYEMKHDFLVKMDRNSSGSLGYYSEIFYLRDDPNKDLTFVRGDTSDWSEGSSGKAYSESKNGYSKTISVTATYKNDSCKEQTITQWFGFYAGLGKASTYSHKAEFTMELTSPGVIMSTTSRPAEHTYGDNYFSDSEKHWRVCSVCGSEGDPEEHVYDNDCDTDCNICGKERTVTHDWQEKWSSDREKHWHECSVCHEKKDEAAHEYDNDCDATCNICNAARTVTHNWQTEWSSDGEKHWHECSICHERKDEAVHEYENACDVACNVCGKERTVTHDWQENWSSDGEKHWHECSICHEKKDEALHEYDDACDATCNICDAVRTVTHNWKTEWSSDDTSHWYECSICHVRKDEAAHEYDNACDATCNVCSEERTITHNWQEEWSSDGEKHWHECSVCHERKDEAAHSYDNDCDITCDVCGAVRTVTHSWKAEWSSDDTTHWHECSICHEKKDEAAHEYDNACDAACNVCAEERTVAHDWQENWSSDGENHWHECSICHERKDEAVHTYDNDLDGDCNICGAERTIGYIHDWQTEWSSDGEKHWLECSACHERKDEAAHTPEADDNDCSTAIHCSVCSVVTTPAQSHDFSGTLQHDASGHWHKCANSGCTVTDGKQDHEWTEGEPNPAPTYSEEGQRIDTCACGETRTVVLPKLIDNIVPTVTLSSLAGNITSISPISVTITFSKDVTGFDLEDITVTNGEKSNFAALSATVYTVDITPGAQGTVTVNVPAGVAMDMAGNGNAAAAELSITYTIKSYTVKFLDYDRRELKVETVNHGSSATAPDDPTREGYIFTGWDKAYDNITSDLTITAQYVIKSYTVKFVDYDGRELKVETVNHGSSATAPASPTREGYTFTNWDKAFDHVTGDLTVTAVYRKSPSSGGEGGPSVTPEPQTATVTGSVVNGNTGREVTNIEAKITMNSDGSSTITMDARQAIVLKEPDGNISKLSDISKITIATDTGSQIPISADGTIKVENLEKGTENSLKISYDLGNGQRIIIGTMNIRTDEKGNANITITLVDPYGIITDSVTGKAIDGVKLTLYYADTERNRASGKTPGTEVLLPLIDGFKPNDNQNPQISDAAGAYGYMVFPHSDYYIVGEKEGYNKYISPIISVEEEIVKWDFKMHQAGAERIYGQSRVETSIEIAKTMYANNIPNVVIATAENYPDALAGSVLASKLNAPILLVGSSEEDQRSILSYLKEYMNPEGTVYILGGTGAVSRDFETQIKEAGFNNIDRIDGKDRYETSVKIAKKIGVKSGTPIVLVSGENYPDALSASSPAAIKQYPILLTEKNGIPDSVKREILEINPSKIYIIGLEGAIDTEVEEEAAEITHLDKLNIIRIGGTNRYETSLEIAKYFDLSEGTVCVATGNNFADALAGSLYAARNNAPIILVGKTLSDDQMTYLKNMELSNVVVFGGEAAVNGDILEELTQLLKP